MTPPTPRNRLGRSARRILSALAAALAATTVVLLLARILPAPFQRLEGQLSDLRNEAWLHWRGPSPLDPPCPVTVVDIDERTLSALGLYGLPYRRWHAALIDTLVARGAGAVAFDVLFKNSDSGREALADWQQAAEEAGLPLPVGPSRERLRQALDVTARLERSLARCPSCLVAAQLGDRRDYPNPSDWIPRARRAWSDSIGGGLELPPDALAELPRLGVLDQVHPSLARAAPAPGLANVEPDLDGKVRRLHLLRVFPDTALVDPHLAPEGLAPPRAYPALALRAAQILTGSPPDSLRRLPDGSLDLGVPLRIRRRPDGRLSTSIPGFTGGMVEAVLASRATLEKLRGDRSGVAAPCEPLALRRRADGALVADLAPPDTLGPDILATLAGLPPDTSWFGQIPPDGSPAALADRILLRRLDGDFEFVALDRPLGPGALEVARTPIPRASLALLVRSMGDAPAARPGGPAVHLSNWIEFRWDAPSRQLQSSLPALRGPVLDSLLALPAERLAALPPGAELAIGARLRIPTDRDGSLLLPFRSVFRSATAGTDEGWIRHVSLIDVLRGRLDPALVPGRAFLVGSAAVALGDFVDVPVERRHPGVDLQALALETILSGRFLTPLPAWARAALPWAAGLAAALLLALLPPTIGLAAIPVGLAAAFGASVWAFDRGIWCDLLPAAAAFALSGGFQVAVRYFLEERERRFLHASFRTYLSPALIDILVESGERPRLGGEEREVTAFFSDIQGFSTFSERIGSPSELVVLLNEYLGSLTGILSTNGGTLDKYIGDAIVAMFGAPLALPDHARLAVETALDMQDELARLRLRWKAQGGRWPDIVHAMRTRIGLNTGRMVTGNMGSSLRMNYTMMGDEVNLAARLEGAAKQYGVFVLASEATIEAAGTGFLTRELDRLRVVGKSEPVTIHEILCRKRDASDRDREGFAIFARARASYLDGDFAAAREMFLAADQLDPLKGGDGVKIRPGEVFARRCREYASSPPTAWNGIHNATEK